MKATGGSGKRIRRRRRKETIGKVVMVWPSASVYYIASMALCR